MTVSPLRAEGWRGPGCGADCLPRSHDPISHERYGYERAWSDRSPRIVKTGPLAMDLHARTVAVGDKAVVVSRLEWALLAYLAEHLDAFCPLSDLTALIVDGRERVQADDARLRNIKHRLRRRLGPDAARLIVGGRPYTPGVRLVYVEPTL